MKIIILMSIALAHFSVAAQTDSSHIKKVEFTYLKIEGSILCAWASKTGIIQTDSVWTYVQNRCRSNTTDKPDFRKYTVWQRSSNGDCHAGFTHELFMDSVAKKMIWQEYNYYGGCRGAKSEDFRIMFPNPPDGYTFELREIRFKKGQMDGRW